MVLRSRGWDDTQVAAPRQRVKPPRARTSEREERRWRRQQQVRHPTADHTQEATYCPTGSLFGPLGTLFHGLCDGGHCNAALGHGTACVAGGVWSQRQVGVEARSQGRGLSLQEVSSVGHTSCKVSVAVKLHRVSLSARKYLRWSSALSYGPSSPQGTRKKKEREKE